MECYKYGMLNDTGTGDSTDDQGYWYEVFHSPWFERAWVIQEVAKASNVSI